MRVALLLALGVVLGSGCSGLRSHHQKSPTALAANPQLSSLERAHLLRVQGNHTAAVIEYKSVVASVQDDLARDEARIGAAKSLIKMHKLPAALVTLGPLPTDPCSETDCRRLAIAGEIYLRQKQTKEAETCLELALEDCPLETLVARARRGGDALHAGPATVSNPVTRTGYQSPAESPALLQQPEIIPRPFAVPAPLPPGVEGPSGVHPPAPRSDGVTPVPTWIAGCCANLGYAYLKNDKPEKASIMYGFAAHLYRFQGDRIAAERARRVSDDLDAVLRQYAPYKPAPLTQHLHSGKQ